MERPLQSADGDAPRKEAAGAVPAPEGFLIRDVRDSCRECWGCVRHCPARAIRVVGGHSEVIVEKCVKCGLCVSACGNAGHLVRDDTQRVVDLLKQDRPVVAVLATEFVAALYPMSPEEVERAVEATGFYAAESTLLGEEMVALEYEQLHARQSTPLVLRSTCPVAVSWVQHYHPSLVSALAPVVPPYVAQACLVKTLYPEGTAVVYISPCYARKDEAYDPQFEGAVDAAIDFTELARLIRHPRPRAASASALPPGSRRPTPVKELSLTDGYARRTMAERARTDPEVQVVRGLQRLEALLRAIEAGEAAPRIVDMLNCEGCIDGPAVDPGRSVFAKRNIVAAERAAHAFSAVGSRELLGHLPSVTMPRAFAADPVILPVPTGVEIDDVLAEGEFASRADTIDCGACGYATCVEHAVAILEGNSSWDMCFPLQRRRMSRDIERLSETATVDALTGLWNRRAFADRLAEEVGRSVRYGTEVSLLMVDVDGFKDINDRFGHVAGDSVLAGVADIMRENLRMADVPTRYGGDEFAIILPGIGKTEAFVVAEKLRVAVSRHPSVLREDGYSHAVSVRISVGVAAAWRGIDDPVALLDAADRALYQAKELGRDQVRLAPG